MADLAPNRQRQKVMRMPDTYLIIGGIALLVCLMSLVLPPGQFDVRTVVENGHSRTVVDAESFRVSGEADGTALFSTDSNPGLFNAVFEGMTSGSRTGGAVGIMAFILLTGGAFGVVMATGAINRGVRSLVRGSLSGTGLLSGLFVVFSLGGAVFGMGEEVAPFVLMLLPLMHRLGYDSITALLVTFFATQIGFATSWMNPFSVAIAQGIAQLPLLSGMPLRLVMWAVFTLVGLVFALRYAAQVRTEPGSSDPGEATQPLGLADWLVLGSLFLVVVWIIWGVTLEGYYLPEIATQFVILGIAAGLIGCLFRMDQMDSHRAMDAFRRGAMDLLPAAMVVGFARGIVYLMGGDDPTTPSMLNTMLHAGSQTLTDLPGWFAAWSMFAVQSVFNFFVTSGSGQAALTMPLMAPLADLIGVSRQVAVLAFQLGDGLTNMVVPTSAALMACLGAAKVEWTTWVRTMARFFAILLLIASGFVIAAHLTGYT